MIDRPLCDILKEKARKELNEEPSRREADLKLLKEWLAKQTHLNARTDDTLLLNFLRYSKFCQQRAREKLDHFYTMKPLAPEFHSNRDPLLPEVQEILKRGILLPLSLPDNDVILIRWQNADPNKATIENIIKVGCMILDIYLMESQTCMIVGCHIIDDFSHFPLGYLRQVSLSIIRKIFLYLQKGYPTRIKGFHIINAPLAIEALINAAKHVVSKKLRNRTHIYRTGKADEMYKIIPQSVLPKEYGGQSASVDEIAVKWKEKIESYRNWFLEDEQHRAESKRPLNPGNSSDRFDLQSSFRKLEID